MWCDCLIKMVGSFLESKYKHCLFWLKTSKLHFRYTGHKIGGLNIESDITASDNWVLSGSMSGDLWCWDLVTGEVKLKLTHTRNKALNSISVHPRKDIILTACVTTVKLWGDPSEVVEQEEQDVNE